MGEFIIFPAVDLHLGEVVRLEAGALNRQTTYSSDPAKTSARWLAAGAKWLHVVNLDGAFDQPDLANRAALGQIVKLAALQGANVQFGGGLRSEADVERILSGGIARAILGTLAIERPESVANLITRWGGDRIAVSLDARDGQVQVHGWQSSSGISALEVARKLAGMGLRWLIFTDISRDGLLQGLNLDSTRQLAEDSGLEVIASGGVAGPLDICSARRSGLAGVIVGKALYKGKIDLAKILKENEC